MDLDQIPPGPTPGLGIGRRKPTNAWYCSQVLGREVQGLAMPHKARGTLETRCKVGSGSQDICA